jgi:hypothetical protein
MNLKILFIASTTFLLFSNLVLAALGIPNSFYGIVTVNGNPSPDGTIVTAKINGIEVGRTTTKNGKYGYEPIFYVDDPNNVRTGSTINFFVNDVDTGKSYPFQNGATTHLDLSIAQSAGTTGPTGPTGSAGGPSTGGSTSSGSSNGGTGTTNNQGTTQPQGCIEKWTCTEWSSCEESVQTRTCTDANKCGTELYKPFESQPCGTKIAQQQAQAPLALPTGFFLSLTTVEWATGIIIGIVAALIIILAIRVSDELAAVVTYWDKVNRKASSTSFWVSKG